MSEGVTWMAFWGRQAGDAQCLPFTSSSLIWELQNTFVTWRRLGGYIGNTGHTGNVGNALLIVGEQDMALRLMFGQHAGGQSQSDTAQPHQPRLRQATQEGTSRWV